MELDHGKLVAALERGDRDALEALLEHHLPALLAWVRLRAGGAIRAHESCIDVVQSSCREVLRRIDDFRVYRDEGDFRRWLYATVERKIQNRARHWARRPAERELEPRARLGDSEVRALSAGYASVCSPSHRAAAREELERVEEAFARLPEDYRRVILEVRLLGRPQADLAREMGRTPEALRQLLHRAVARLARESGMP